MPKRQRPTPEPLQRKKVIVISDLHIGSTVGLWPREHPVQDGTIVKTNRFQSWLHDCWDDFIAQVENLDKPILVLNGDLVDGVNPRNGQMVTNLVSAQAKAAEVLLRPLIEKCSKVFAIRGTEWHEGKASDDVEQLADRLGAVHDPNTGQSTRWELYLSVDDRVIHFAHHVGVSSVPWYESTVPTRDALMLIAELTRFYGNKAPNVQMVVRSHRHRYVQTHLPPNLTVAVTPAWQLKTAFAYKKATAMLPEIGWLEIKAKAPRLVVEPHIYPLPKLRIEEA